MLECNTLKVVQTDDYKYELVKYRMDEGPWHYGIVSYQKGLNGEWESPVDVEEMSELEAIRVFGSLFNVHITDEQGVCRT